jgi:hypothetical protein
MKTKSSKMHKSIAVDKQGCALFASAITLRNKASVAVPFTLRRPHRGLSLSIRQLQLLCNSYRVCVIDIRLFRCA